MDDSNTIMEEECGQRESIPNTEQKGRRPLRVCMLAYTIYDFDNRVRRYAEALTRRGDTVEAIVLARVGQPVFEVINGVHVYRIQKRRVDEKGPLSYLRKLMLFFFRSALFVTRRHLAARYDVIHVHSVPDFEVFATLIPRLMGARVILDIHDIVPEFYASKFHRDENAWTIRLLCLVEKLSIVYSSHIIISNHLWEKKLVARAVRPEKCTTIINYPDLSIFYRRPRTTPADGRFIVCYPGTINSHQGVDVAIRAMARLREKAPQIQFHIIGNGPDREKVKNMIHEFDLEKNVFMHGEMTLNEVAAFMANVDLGVVPKLNNPFGGDAFSTKIPEFMAMGVPVVATATRIDRYYFDESMIQFFESGNDEELGESILRLAQDDELRQSLCERAEKFIRENNWDVKKQHYYDLIDGLLERRQHT